MSNEVRLIVPDVFLRTGPVFYEYVTQTLADWWSDPGVGSLFQSSSGVVVISWNVPYLRIRAQALRETASGQKSEPAVSFVSDTAQIAKLIEEEIKRVPKFKPAQMIAGKVSPNDVLRLTFVIDTDHVSLIDEVKISDKIDSAYEVTVTCYLLCRNTQAKAEDNGHRQHRKKLSLVLQPTAYAPAYKGIVAVDLGNTNTTLAAVDIDQEPRASSVRVCPELAYGRDDPKQFSLSPHGNLLPSVLRIYSVVDLESSDVSDKLDKMSLSSVDQLRRVVEGYSFDIGQYAQPALWPPDGLVVSPKRQLTARGQNSGNLIRTRLDDHIPPKPNYDAPCDYELKMTAELPAELFICRLFQIFKSIKRTYPRRIVVTYPTSYTRYELSQIVDAVYNAWKLAERFNPHGPFSQQEIVPLAIDEATAAAFFYLARFVLEGPGGLRTFRWLYPKGFYLLVYDCGGATTDISLVHASSKELDTLSFSVMGRTGLRDFGGDEITVATFLLLKAKLACALASARGESLRNLPTVKPGSPQTVKELQSSLRDEWFLQRCDRYVPTDFDGFSLSSGTDIRKALTLALWDLAEAIKQGIRDAVAPRERIIDYLKRYHGSNFPNDEIKRALEKLTVANHEIDALVLPQVEKSVRVCKALLETKLDFRAGMVDDIFIIGNGSRYPLITEQLRNSLLGETTTVDNLQSADDGFSPIENMLDTKHAVAKGAALALAMKESALGIRIEFDHELSNRLPFTIAWFNAASQSHIELFREGQPYDQLEPRSIQVFPQKDGGKLEWIRLEHQWPGGEYEKFLLFHFPQGVEGEVIISFDPEQRQFVAQSTQTGELVTAQREIDPSVYLAPVQRGKIRLPAISM